MPQAKTNVSNPGQVRRTAAWRSLVAFLFFASSASAAPEWYLEMPHGTPGEGAARRTLALELEGIVVPPDPIRIGDSSEDVALHISVTVEDGVSGSETSEWLLVRVWDRGEFAGTKRVSALGHPTTVGRRVALAAAELVRQLAAVRTRNLRLDAKRQRESESERKIERREAERRRLALESDLHAVWATEGAWLAGPGLGVELNRELPWRFRAGVALLAGEVYGIRPEATSTPVWSWFDAHFGPYWVRHFGPNWSGELGSVLTLTLVDLAGGASADGIPDHHTTWTARVGLDVGASTTLGPSLRLRFGLGGGALLRRIPIELDDTETRFGGGYLGLRISLLTRRPW